MTATNHALTGALVAVVVKQPFLALPLAFAAHFVMDVVPHFGITVTKDVLKKHKTPLFLSVLKADVAVSGLLLLLVPFQLHTEVNWLLLLGCMIACMSPDLVWGYRYYFELRDKKARPLGWFSMFHKRIQWSETEAGALVEVGWCLSVASLVLVAT